ncbi:MAG: leucine-rich repeat domain-containing protein [Deltaproteobacteria bacterium]|nr:leucine-rich repeat domain-containing protein [Deltaproteobacteria bacterium]
MPLENQCRVRNSDNYLFSPEDCVLQSEPHQSKNPTLPSTVVNPLLQHNDTWGRRMAVWFGKRDDEDFRDFIHRNTGVYIYKFGEGVVPTGKYARAEIAAKIAAENPLSAKVTEHQIDVFAFAAAAAFGAFGCAEPGPITRNPSPEQDASNMQRPDTAIVQPIDAQETHQDAAAQLPDVLIEKDGGISTDSETQFPDAETLYDATPEDAAQDAGVVTDSGVAADSGVVTDSGIATDSGVIPDAGMCPSTDPQLVPICTCDSDGDGIITDRFPDRSFLSQLRNAFGRPRNADITVQDALRTSQLQLTSPSLGVARNVLGVECFVNLTRFHLNQPSPNNGITDVTPFASLVHLTELVLWRNNISDITPFSNLHNLTHLVLTQNLVSDITPVMSLPQLTFLSIAQNPVPDLFPLAALVNLNTLYADANHQAYDLTPLSSLTNLTVLTLGSNQISDVTPLSGLINLRSLALFQNPITDIGPLISNPGLSAGDTVDLQQDPQIHPAQIAALRAKGVNVIWP